jgi:hypothetical protein
VRLYIDPPAKAIVLCVDEKPSIQALKHLKLPNGRALTGQSHDYKHYLPGPRSRFTSGGSKTAVSLKSDSGY